MADSTPAVTISLNNPHLAGLPIIVTAKAEKDRPNVTFRRIILDVTVKEYTKDNVDNEVVWTNVRSASFEFSMPVDFEWVFVNGERKQQSKQQKFDVASAVRAMTDNYEPTATQAESEYSYPSYKLDIQSYEEYMTDGNVLKIGGQGITMGENEWIFMGTLSDIDRIYSKMPARWSKKPTSSPQIVFIGHQFLSPGVAADGTPVTWTIPEVKQGTIGPGLNTIDDYYPVYGIDRPADGYEIRFVNSLGVHENTFITCLRTVEVAIATDKYVVARQETVSEFSRGLAIKKNNHERWKMSSGPLDKAWQQWYLHEVLMTRWSWLLINSKWVPCHILPEETTTGIDRAGAKPLTVEFTIEFDITGSPFV